MTPSSFSDCWAPAGQPGFNKEATSLVKVRDLPVLPSWLMWPGSAIGPPATLA